jgi:hypothetical protein
MFFRRLHRSIEFGHLIVGLVFILSAVALLVLAVLHLWEGISPFHYAEITDRVDVVLSAIAVLTVALASLELGQTIIEEEVQRGTAMSAPTRVRRFLSRFMIILVVALSIEALVGVFQFIHTDPRLLPQAAAVGLVAAALLAAWGVFVWLNREVEELEPGQLERVRKEDKKVIRE